MIFHWYCYCYDRADILKESLDNAHQFLNLTSAADKHLLLSAMMVQIGLPMTIPPIKNVSCCSVQILFLTLSISLYFSFTDCLCWTKKKWSKDDAKQEDVISKKRIEAIKLNISDNEDNVIALKTRKSKLLELE